MTLAELLAELDANAVSLEAVGETLRIAGASEALTPTVRAALKVHKADLLSLAARGGKGLTASPIILESTPRLDPFDLTEVQQAYWIGRQGFLPLGGVSTHYYGEFDCVGVDAQRLNDSFNELVARHDMLRAVVNADGRQQVLAEAPAYEIAITDAETQSPKARERAIQAIRSTLSSEVRPSDKWPLFSIKAVRIAADRLHLFVSIDLLIADFISLSRLAWEWRQIYEGAALQSPPAVTFRDCVAAMRRMSEATFERDRDYWAARLERLPPPPPLPTLRGAEPHFERLERRLSPEAWRGFRDLARQARVSTSAALLTAFAEVLAVWSNCDAFTLAVTQFNRPPLHPRIMEVIGDFTGVSLAEMRRDGTKAFGDRARATQARLLRDLEHSAYSGVRVARDRSVKLADPAAALFPVVFTSAVGAAGAIESAGFELFGAEITGISQTPQVSLDHVVFEQDNTLRFRWDFRKALFPQGMIEDMFDAYEALLMSLSSDPLFWGQSIRVATPRDHLDERALANATAVAVAGPGTLHGLVLAAAAKWPSATAIVADGRTWTYAELVQAANTIAGRLSTGAGPVAVVASTAWQAVLALGVSIANRPFVPLSTAWPSERCREILDEAAAVQIVTDMDLDWAPPEVQVLKVGDGSEAELASSPPIGRAEDLAYIIFTSGSSGRPKGVAIRHSAAVNTIVDVNARYGVAHDDCVLNVSDIAFDLSIYDIFGTLAAGGRLVVADEKNFGRRNPDHWRRLIEKYGVTVWNSVPGLMEMLVEHCEQDARRLPSLRTILLSGDWIPVSLPSRIARIADQAAVHSLGGATEAAIWSIEHRITPADATRASIPYGRPLANQRWLILDREMEPCPKWVPGELFIAGAGLADGYWRNTELTSTSFIFDPHSGERLYRTGDEGRYIEGGSIEFLGRRDMQVKVGGHRIELEEIEAKICALPGVMSAAVVVLGNGARRSLAALVAGGAQELRVERLVSQLQTRLPTYMTPRRIEVVAALPLTANGKVDRKAVAEWFARSHVSNGGGQVASTLEARLVEIVLVVTGLTVRPDQNFFEEGLTSVDLVKLHGEIEASLGIQLEPVAAFEHPTIRLLAEHLSRNPEVATLDIPKQRAFRRERLDRLRTIRSQDRE